LSSLQNDRYGAVYSQGRHQPFSLLEPPLLPQPSNSSSSSSSSGRSHGRNRRWGANDFTADASTEQQQQSRVHSYPLSGHHSNANRHSRGDRGRNGGTASSSSSSGGGGIERQRGHSGPPMTLGSDSVPLLPAYNNDGNGYGAM
jgi:hypothetical protein